MAEARISELGTGLGTLTLGLVAVIAIRQQSDLPSLSLMLEAWDSPIWGVLALVSGAGQLWAGPLIDGEWRWPWARWVSAALSSWLWMLVTVSIIVEAHGITPGAIGALTIGLICSLLTSRILFWPRR